ncbi:MAG: hypothetical protein V3U48_10740 [Rhodospirillales bacterium]
MKKDIGGRLMSFFQALIHPDREELNLKDRLIVISAANQLRVGEFQLLQLAYRDWFGRNLPEEMVSRLFSSYMLHNEVPHWARHYARHVLERYERGELDDTDPAFHRYDADYRTSMPQGVQRFCVAAAGVILAVFGGIYVANQVVDSPASLLAPYFEK